MLRVNMYGIRWALVLVLCLSGRMACKVTNPLYCDDRTACPDPLRPYCDIDGVYAESAGVRNTCIASPLDTSVPDAAPVATDAMPAACIYEIAFISDRDGTPEVFLMASDGTDVRRLTDSGKDKQSLVWSPDGRAIFLVETSSFDGQITASDIVRVDIETAAATTFASPGLNRHPRISRNGDRLAFISDEDGDAEVFTINADGSGRAQLTHNSFADDAPDWSPADDSLVFTHNSSSVPRIYAMGSDGSDQRALTGDPGPDIQPKWSPAGDKITFVSFRDGISGMMSIYIMNSDGTEQQSVITIDARVLLYEFSYEWSPAGDAIVFKQSSDELLGDLWSVGIDGTSPSNLTNSSVTDSTPQWSPDGLKIIYRSGSTGIGEIYIMNRDGSEPINLTDHEAGDTAPAVSPCLPER